MATKRKKDPSTVTHSSAQSVKEHTEKSKSKPGRPKKAGTNGSSAHPSAKKPVANLNGHHPPARKKSKRAPATISQAPTPPARPLGESPEVQEKVKELIKLAKEQGYLTFDDLNEALPDSVNDPDEMEVIISRLRNMEISIIEASDVDQYKDGRKEADEEEEEKSAESKNDMLDDPVRMYLKQMGQVPLLTREQEVEISKRIEDAEAMVQRHINRFGFIARAYLDLAHKLAEGRERFDRVILDKKIESRERYMKNLPRLCETLEKHASEAAHAYRVVLNNGAKNHHAKSYQEFEKAHDALQKLYPKFFFKQKITEEFVNLADETYRIINNLNSEAAKPKSAKSEHASRTDYVAKLRDLQSRIWLTPEEFVHEYNELKGWFKKLSKPRRRWWKPTFASSSL